MRLVIPRVDVYEGKDTQWLLCSLFELKLKKKKQQRSLKLYIASVIVSVYVYRVFN